MRNWRTSILQLILATVLSLALWTYVSFSQNPSRLGNFTVPITITPPPNTLIAVDPNTGRPLNGAVTTNVQVSGPDADFARWSNTSFRAVLDLSSLEAGTYDVPITVTTPPNARIRTVAPATLPVRLEPEQTRVLPVEPKVSGSVPFLFQAATPEISVQNVTVSGPESLVSRVAQIVIPVNLQDRITSFNEAKAPEAVDQNGNVVEGLTVAPETITVSVAIQPRVERQRAQIVPRTSGQLPTGYRFDLDWNPKFVDVIATIPITGTLYTERIDLTDRTESFTQTVELAGLDESVQVLTEEPIVVNVTIAPITQPYNASVVLPISTVNVPQNVNVALNPPSVTVTINGTTSQFQQLGSSTLQGTVDLSNLTPGTYTRPVTIALPAGLQIVGDPPVISVTLTERAPTPQPSPGG